MFYNNFNGKLFPDERFTFHYIDSEETRRAVLKSTARYFYGIYSRYTPPKTIYKIPDTISLMGMTSAKDISKSLEDVDTKLFNNSIFVSLVDEYLSILSNTKGSIDIEFRKSFNWKGKEFSDDDSCFFTFNPGGPNDLGGGFLLFHYDKNPFRSCLIPYNGNLVIFNTRRNQHLFASMIVSQLFNVEFSAFREPDGNRGPKGRRSVLYFDSYYLGVFGTNSDSFKEINIDESQYSAEGCDNCSGYIILKYKSEHKCTKET